MKKKIVSLLLLLTLFTTISVPNNAYAKTNRSFIEKSSGIYMGSLETLNKVCIWKLHTRNEYFEKI